MPQSYKTNLLTEKIFFDIDNGLKENINAEILAQKYNISTGHLRRLFRHAHKQTLGEYIRIKKLSSSLNDLLKKDSKIIDIALDYGFDYESAFIRSFKREFGITPGKYRKENVICG